MDIESGHPAFILSDLSVERYPQRFTFYDPLMIIVQSKISDERRAFILNKTQFIQKHTNNQFISTSKSKSTHKMHYPQAKEQKDELIKLCS